MSPTIENSWLIEASSIVPVWLKWEEIKKMFKEQSSRVHCIMSLLLYKVVWVKIKNKEIFTFELDINVGPKIIATLGTPILLIVDNSTTLKKKKWNKYVIHCKLPFNQTLVTGVICKSGCLWFYGRFNYLRVRMQLHYTKLRNAPLASCPPNFARETTRSLPRVPHTLAKKNNYRMPASLKLRVNSRIILSSQIECKEISNWLDKDLVGGWVAVGLGPWGPFLESRVNFSGPKSHS